MRDVIVAGLFYFLALGALYLVNAPRAVDFLIATESELRKVSWPSRPDLLRQTVVVLTTVAIFTVVILVADIFLSYLMKVIRGL
jgi:preprotein translocase subunit SecE